MKTLSRAVLSLSIVATSTLFAADLSKTKESIQNIEFVKKVGFTVKDVKDLNDVYAVNASHPKTPKLTLFVSKDLKTVVIGQGFMANGEPIDFPVNMAQYQKEAVYTIGQGKNEYYLFTDPECPVCRQYEQMLEQLKEDVKIYVLFYPLNYHKDAQKMCKYILSQNSNDSRAQAMREIALGKEDYKNLKLSEKDDEKYQKIINKHLTFGEKIGINGTPAVFDSNGRAINRGILLNIKNNKEQ